MYIKIKNLWKNYYSLWKQRFNFFSSLPLSPWFLDLTTLFRACSLNFSLHRLGTILHDVIWNIHSSGLAVRRQRLSYYSQSPTRRQAFTKIDKIKNLICEKTVYKTRNLKWSNNLTFDNSFRKAFVVCFFL